VVEHRQDQRLEHDALAERADHRQDRAAREVDLALPIGAHVAAEPEPAQVVRAPRGDRADLEQPVDLGVVVPEVLDQSGQPAETGDDAVPPAARQAAGEALEDGRVVDAAVLDERREHGELVAVGQHAGPLAPAGRVRCRPHPELSLTF
jgi:hypothetical protein